MRSFIKHQYKRYLSYYKNEKLYNTNELVYNTNEISKNTNENYAIQIKFIQCK